ncbi:MAG: hypothetical protein GY845_29355, partial [Planctomycetes bacterium]|nr:hypothetical protein [Planctomycetota bacterium]
QDGWVEIYEYADTLKNWFEIQIDPTGAFVNGVGIGAYMDPTEPPIYPNNPWFNYLEDDWWNVWFYDHPLDPERLKDIWIEYTVMPFEQAIPELYAEVTPNWATDLWTLDGMPPGEPRPPLPGDFDYSTTPPVPPEAEWIGRGDPPNIHAGPEPDGRYFLRIPDYNPEWVSVDVRGTNVWVEGTIYHLCRASLDLAFVVTSDFAPDPEGACCYPEPTGSGDILCIVTTLANCEQNLGGSYQGDGTVCGGSIEACCLPDGSCIMADIYCCVNELGGTPQGAGSSCSAPEGCCFPDGSCQDLDPLCCVDLGGTPQGAGTTCTAVEACCMTDGTCQMLDPLCCVDLGGSPQGAQTSCTAVEACCFNDGSCQDLDPLCCIDLGGTPEGAGTACATTTCEVIPEEQKIWKQAPDLSTEGMDVNAMVPLYVLADDFQCTKTEGIQEIHIWGSWFEDIYPGADPPSIEGDPGQVGFHLSLHTDVPAGVLESWSMPGEMVAEWFFEPGEFIYKKVNLEGPHEGWFNPPAEWFPIGDHNCYEYIFKFDETNWFEQQGTAGAPVIYWLDVQAAVVLEGSAFFGWKTSASHWNDDAVWFDGVDGPGQLPWFEMRYPMGHPFETESVDLAFMIGGPCDCQPGEADGITTEINILDIVHLINYKYKGGADPIPYALCSGDANCNCTVDILDIVYVINYKYKGGSYPCTCADFILACPGGLR